MRDAFDIILPKVDASFSLLLWYECFQQSDILEQILIPGHLKFISSVFPTPFSSFMALNHVIGFNI